MEKTQITCPSCAGRVVDEGTWIHNGRYYCSQECCRKAALSS